MYYITNIYIYTLPLYQYNNYNNDNELEGRSEIGNALPSSTNLYQNRGSADPLLCISQIW